MIAVAREALVALAHGLEACGDSVALYAFSSLRKERVFVDVCKSFDEPFGAKVDARIAALKPGFYTRLGAAMRHASFRLGERPNARKLLLVITDGKPNDLDHYEGRFGVEDTRHAAQEARRRGQAVFCVAIDAQARSYLPHLFGPVRIFDRVKAGKAERGPAGDLSASCRINRAVRAMFSCGKMCHSTHVSEC